MPSLLKYKLQCEACDSEYYVLVDERNEDPSFCPFCSEEIDFPLGYIVDEVDDESPWDEQESYNDEE